MPNMPTKSELKRNLKVLRARLEQKPMDLDARMRMARTHRLLGEKKGAVSHYRAVARYLSLSGQPLQAIAVLKELLQVDPEHEETLLFLAKLYARTRVHEQGARGRVAVPLADAPTGPIALPEGLPASATGLWNSIRPLATDIFTVVRDADEVGAEVSQDGEAVSIAAELRELEDTLDLDEDDIVEEQAIFSGEAQEFEPDESDAICALEPGDDASTEEQLLPQVPLFSSLPPEAFVELSAAMTFRRAQAGEVLFEEGDTADSLLVFASGEATASRSGGEEGDIELMNLSSGDFAGLFALVAAERRSATLRAVSHVEYFEIHRDVIDTLVAKHPSVKEALGHFFRERLLMNLLAVLPCFSTLDSAARQALTPAFKNKRYKSEDELFYQGFEHDGLWVILEGNVRLGREGEPATQTLGVGDYVGSFAGIDDGAAEMAAVASTDAVVALLSHKAMGDALRSSDDLAGVRRGFTEAGLMVTQHVFAGNARFPGRLRHLRPIFI